MNTAIAFVLVHVHEFEDGHEDTKLVGVYSSLTAAEVAKARMLTRPGFRESPEGFDIYECHVDKDLWSDGFVTVEPGEG